jgi:hypothetical protein
MRGVARAIIYERRPADNGPDGSFEFHTGSHRMRDAAESGWADTRETMESAAKRRLGDIIVERGLITAEQLEEALVVQRASGSKLGEVLVELGFLTRVALAGVITEQWDDLRVTTSGRMNAETNARSAARAGSSVVETALRERLEALTDELAARDQRIAQQDATIAALLGQLGSAAA